MTSTVKVSAHCTPDKEVKITLVDYDGKETVVRLQDGENYESYVYDSRSISVEELHKDHDK